MNANRVLIMVACVATSVILQMAGLREWAIWINGTVLGMVLTAIVMGAPRKEEKKRDRDDWAIGEEKVVVINRQPRNLTAD